MKAPYYSPKAKTPSGNTRGGYATYIATREGVELLRSGMASYVGERRGSCGLFSDEGVPIVMSKITDEIDNHNGNVWGFIISLKREDSERLGYNKALSWMNLLRSRRNDIAKEMHISPENLRWYGAYHDKEDHPHVHVLVWSDNPNEPHLSKDGIRNIKEEAEYYLKEAAELGNHHAAFLLYKCYRDKVIEPEYKTSAKHYLYKAADMGNSAAEYILGKELLTKNPGKAKEYLLSSASKNNPQSMYLLGKVLLDEGKEEEALK